jgi:hypothetical protein
VNRQMVWALTFEFSDRLGARHTTEVRTSTPAALADESTEPVLYDPERPAHAYVLDELPSRPQFDVNGDLAGRTAGAIGALLIPAIVIGGWGFLYALKYGLLRK